MLPGDSGVSTMTRGRYGVVVCTKCRNAKGVDLVNKNTRCTRCGKQLSLKRLRVYYRSDSQAEIADKVGVLNARLRNVEITEQNVTDNDPYIIAVKESSLGSNERERLLILARVLTRELGTFERSDLERIVEIQGTGDPDEMMELFNKLDEVYQPQRNVFRAVDI